MTSGFNALVQSFLIEWHTETRENILCDYNLKRGKQMFKSVAITLDGSDSIFSVEKKVSFFFHHETIESMKQQAAGIVKEVRKMAKNGQVMVTVMEMDENCHRSDVHRFIVNQYDFNLDSRKFNASSRDYSNNTIYTFINDSQRFNYMKKELEKMFLFIMDGIPQDGKGWYGRKLNDDYVPEEILVTL